MLVAWVTRSTWSLVASRGPNETGFGTWIAQKTNLNLWNPSISSQTHQSTCWCVVGNDSGFGNEPRGSLEGNRWVSVSCTKKCVPTKRIMKIALPRRVNTPAPSACRLCRSHENRGSGWEATRPNTSELLCLHRTIRGKHLKRKATPGDGLPLQAWASLKMFRKTATPKQLRSLAAKKHTKNKTTNMALRNHWLLAVAPPISPLPPKASSNLGSEEPVTPCPLKQLQGQRPLGIGLAGRE